MHILNILGSLLGVVSLAEFVAADLRIKADHFSFGGINYPGLQVLEPKERDDVIRAIVKSGARVIRMFIQGNEKFPDPELELGSFDPWILEQYDDTFAAIHRISKGKVKVILAPHNAHAIRGSNNIPCDAYCHKVDGAFLDFYSNQEIREKYRTRLGVFLREFPSKNFKGRPWAELNEVILGVDVQNEPWSGIWPIVAGEPWLCEIATYLKDTIGLGDSGIAVISGGISGAQSVDGAENFPDSAMDCPAIDVIGIHGYFKMDIDDDKTAGTDWAEMFVPGNTLTARAKGNKLLLVEEMAYGHTKWGFAYKKAAIWDQGNALNYRGIPWIYSHGTTGGEGTTAAVNVLNGDNAAIGALKDVMKRAAVSRSNFDWSPYLSPPPALSNLTHAAINPFTHETGECTFGCPGWLCDAADGCEPNLICKNSICTKPSESQPGSVGAECDSKKLCQAHLRCEAGSCQECAARLSIQPEDKRKRAVAGHVDFQCQPDHFSLLTSRDPPPDTTAPWPVAPPTIKSGSRFCLKPEPFTSPHRRGNPCEKAEHCDANEFCDWGFCKVCGEKDKCLGAKCRSISKCKTGFCNSYGKCDYAGKEVKRGGPGARARARSARSPMEALGGKAGPQKVVDQPIRINFPKEEAKATGKPAATS